MQMWGIPPNLGSGRVLHAGKWLWVRAIGWIISLIFVIMLVFGLSVEALGELLPKQPAPQFVVQVTGACLVLMAYAVLVRFGEGRAPDELSLRAAPLGVLTGVAIGLAMFAVVMLIMVTTGLYSFDYYGPRSAWHGAGLAIQSAVVEEVLVRGVVLRILWRAFGPWVAFTISAVLFGAGHIGNPGATWFTTLCIALEAGVMLGAFYALTGRLWMSIGVHAGWNFTQGYLFGATVSGGNFGNSIANSVPLRGHPEWLTGGAFGPEASLPSFAICVAVGALVLWLAQLRGSFAKAREVARPT